MGKYLGLKKGGPYSGMVRFVRRSDSGSPLFIYFIVTTVIWMFIDGECDGGWKYNPSSNTFYCHFKFMSVYHGGAANLCDSRLYTGSFPKAVSVSIESVEEHQLIIDNVPEPPGMIHTHI